MKSSNKTETIRVRIEPEKKDALTAMYAQRGTNVSDEIRIFLDSELEACADPLDRFDSIMTSADRKLEAYGAPEPTIDDIKAYVSKIRSQRGEGTAVA